MTAYATKPVRHNAAKKRRARTTRDFGRKPITIVAITPRMLMGAPKAYTWKSQSYALTPHTSTDTVTRNHSSAKKKAALARFRCTSHSLIEGFDMAIPPAISMVWAFKKYLLLPKSQNHPTCFIMSAYRSAIVHYQVKLYHKIHICQ